MGGWFTSEHHRAGEVAAVARVSRTHHVLGFEGLVGEFSAGHGTVLLGTAGGLKEVGGWVVELCIYC